MEGIKAVKFITAIILAVTLSLSLVIACPSFSITSKADGPSDPYNSVIHHNYSAVCDGDSIWLLPGQTIKRTVAFNITLQLAPYTGLNTTFHLTAPKDIDSNVRISFSNVRAAKMATTGTYSATMVTTKPDTAGEFVSDMYSLIFYNNTKYKTYNYYTIYVDVEISNYSSFSFHTGYGGYTSTSPANSASMKATIEGYIKNAGTTLGDKVTLALTYTNYLLWTNFGNLYSDGYIKNQVLAGKTTVSFVSDYDLFISSSQNEFVEIRDGIAVTNSTLKAILNAVTALNTNTLLQESQKQTAELEKQTAEAKKQTEEQKKQTEALTKYDNADKMDSEAGTLSGAISEYDQVNDSLFASADAGISAFDISEPFKFTASMISAFGFLSTIIVSIVKNMGNFSILYPIGVSLVIIGALVGLAQFVSNSGGPGENYESKIDSSDPGRFRNSYAKGSDARPRNTNSASGPKREPKYKR